MAVKPISTEDMDHVLEHTRDLWEEMRGERIFITGGTGFFGCWLMESFCHVNRRLELGAKATILTRSPGKFRSKCPHVAEDPAITLHEGDVRDFTFPEGEFRAVVHAASESSSTQETERPLEMWSTLLDGTERTLKFAGQSGARKFLFTSSAAVYGRNPVGVEYVPETYLGAPDPFVAANVYGEGKRAAEQLCALYQRAATEKGILFEAKIARCWVFCGPHLPLDIHFAVGNFIADIMAGRPINIRGDGTPRRSYLYTADLAIWLWTILFRGPALLPIHVGSSHAVSIRELAEVVVATLAPGTPIHVAQKAVSDARPVWFVPSVDRAEKLLGLRQTISLDESIRRTFAWSQG